MGVLRDAAEVLAGIRGLVIDLDGTLVRGSQPLPGLAAFFALLHRRGIAFTVVTNNTVKTPEQYRQKLLGFGADTAPGQVVTASVATAAYLAGRLAPGAALYAIGEYGLRHALQESGFTLVDGEAPAAQAVVAGGDRMLDYGKLRLAIRHILRGAALVGTNPDLLVPTEDGLAPEAGVTLAALQAATGTAPVVIGKPERPLFDLALARMGTQPQESGVLGDRLDTDILGGRRLGLTTLLVTTGADDETAVVDKGIRPDLVVPGLDALVELWSGRSSSR